MKIRNGMAAGLLILCGIAARGEVKPSALFAPHMVLQRDMPVPVWGTADAGEKVTVSFAGQTETATAGADGKWMVKLAKLATNAAPAAMTIAGTNTVSIDDILVGEVWIASGQSNMAFTLSVAKARYAGVVNEAEEIAAADHPAIRMFTVKTAKTYEPQDALAGDWQVCTPENAPGFSAVGYLFARDLNKALDVPVGIVTTAFGASCAEAWISREAMAADPKLKPMLDHFDKAVAFFRAKPEAPGSEAPLPPKTLNSRTAGPPASQRDPVQDQHYPTVLFNGMLNPVIPYAMRGVIWYQGESIVGGEPGLDLYPHVMEALVRDWRARWGEGDFPFYAVQLAALGNLSNNPRVREGQAKILSLPNTGLANTIDIGNPTDVHPHDKAPLGDRLARIALANVYGKTMEFSGPVYESMKADGGKVRVKFSHADGLAAKEGALKWFQVAGADKQFVDAEAAIEGNEVVASSQQVAAPVAVRYAWANYPEGANLYNGAGLPAFAFRSDDWAYPVEGLVADTYPN